MTGHFPFVPNQPAEVWLAQAVADFCTRHGGADGIAAALPDLVDGDSNDAGVPSGPNAGCLFFADGAVLRRDPLSGQWTNMWEPAEEGSQERLSAEKIHWTSQIIRARDRFHQTRQRLLESGDESGIGEVQKAADEVKTIRGIIKILEIGLGHTKEATREAELAARSRQAKEWAARQEAERRDRVKAALAGIKIDGEPLPAVEQAAERRAERDADLRRRMQERHEQHAALQPPSPFQEMTR